MRQQINLYQPIFSEERKPFSAATASACLILLIGVLAAVSINANMRVQKLALTVEALRAQQSDQERSPEGGIQQSEEAIAARIARLERSVRARNRALDILRSGGAGRAVGFAPRLEALARRHVDGLWLDAMQLSGTDSAMMLAGSTLDPDMVPVYLRSLAKDDVLAGTRFDDFIIVRPTNEATDGEEQNHKTYDPKLVRFKATSSALDRTATPESSS